VLASPRTTPKQSQAFLPTGVSFNPRGAFQSAWLGNTSHANNQRTNKRY
jgi:hypothetical protein